MGTNKVNRVPVTRETGVRIHLKRTGRSHEPVEIETQHLADFGGVPPCVGDFIIPEQSGSNKVVFEVIARYFLPTETGKPIINLVVTERQGKPVERNILG